MSKIRRRVLRLSAPLAVLAVLGAVFIAEGAKPAAAIPVSLVAYDQGMCIASCDAQYSSCTSRNNDVQYCSAQHDSCRKACLEHS